jgi:hypothetical protein
MASDLLRMVAIWMQRIQAFNPVPWFYGCWIGQRLSGFGSEYSAPNVGRTGDLHTTAHFGHRSGDASEKLTV